MGIVRQGVQEQVGRSQPCHMLRQRRPSFRENQSPRVDAASRSFLAQIPGCRGIGLRKPQHALLDSRQYPHPAVENRGSDLVRVVEATKYEPLRRQTELLARKRLVGDGVAEFKGYEAARQI